MDTCVHGSIFFGYCWLDKRRTSFGGLTPSSGKRKGYLFFESR